MIYVARSASSRQRLGLIVAAVLGLIAGGMSLLGTRDSWRVSGSSAAASTAGTTIDELDLPPGPHRAEFQAACIICHSARLPLTQPKLNREKWIEIVHKMVTAYGAPATSEDEAQVVDYLLAIQASRS
ncbi:MAG TPA: hypothetical protein VG125_31435 [Pirellulales bacterium]|jgi:mono/diheme cytochrome c family protein|nr:hypothetical protein [Pirellulales bacterium]